MDSYVKQLKKLKDKSIHYYELMSVSYFEKYNPIVTNILLISFDLEELKKSYK